MNGKTWIKESFSLLKAQRHLETSGIVTQSILNFQWRTTHRKKERFYFNATELITVSSQHFVIRMEYHISTLTKNMHTRQHAYSRDVWELNSVHRSREARWMRIVSADSMAPALLSDTSDGANFEWSNRCPCSILYGRCQNRRSSRRNSVRQSRLTNGVWRRRFERVELDNAMDHLDKWWAVDRWMSTRPEQISLEMLVGNVRLKSRKRERQHALWDWSTSDEMSEETKWRIQSSWFYTNRHRSATVEIERCWMWMRTVESSTSAWLEESVRRASETRVMRCNQNERLFFSIDTSIDWVGWESNQLDRRDTGANRVVFFSSHPCHHRLVRRPNAWIVSYSAMIAKHSDRDSSTRDWEILCMSTGVAFPREIKCWWLKLEGKNRVMLNIELEWYTYSLLGLWIGESYLSEIWARSWMVTDEWWSNKRWQWSEENRWPAIQAQGRFYSTAMRRQREWFVRRVSSYCEEIRSESLHWHSSLPISFSVRCPIGSLRLLQTNRKKEGEFLLIKSVIVQVPVSKSTKENERYVCVSLFVARKQLILLRQMMQLYREKDETKKHRC